VIEGFFTQVNQSNFETAKSKYLSNLLINTLNSPSGSHRTPQKSFKEMLGKIKGVEVQGAEVTGETATATAILVMPWGTR
jgi:endonuclease III-like uncharacterized protein